MLKKALKNFYSNAVYIFIAMGIIYLFLIIVTYFLLFKTISGMGGMFGGILDLIGTTVADSETAIEEFVDYALSEINWEQDFLTVVEQILDTNWLKNTVNGFLHTLDVSAENFTDEFNAILNGFVSDTVGNLILSGSVMFLGVCIANWVTGYAIRRKTAKRNFFQYVLNLILQPVFNATLIFAMVWLLAVLKGYALLLYIVLGIVYEMISFSFSWLIFGRGKVPFKKVITLKNIGMNFLASVIIILINIALLALLGLINIFIALLIAIPVLVYSANILNVNADSYIRSLAQEVKAPIVLEEAAPAADNK